MTAIEAAPAPSRRLAWQRASVRDIVVETPRVQSLMLHVPGWRGHRAGQHVDIRLTGEDGYQAQRSYSIASPPEDALVALTVERVENGEVSPYLVDEFAPATFELRGPIGGYFIWTVADGGPLCLIAGGSGIVPLMAMLRHREERVYAPLTAGLLSPIKADARLESQRRSRLDRLYQRVADDLDTLIQAVGLKAA
jgi:ferredoxin-NADP reductase